MDKIRTHIAKNNKYWQNRQSAQSAWIEQHIKDDQQFNNMLKAQYQATYDYIEQRMQTELQKHPEWDKPLSSIKVSPGDARSFRNQAKAVLQNIYNQARRETAKEAENRINFYILTSPYNRLELLKSNIGVELVKLGASFENSLFDHLHDDYQKEYNHSADVSLLFAKSRTDPDIIKVVMMATKGASFSDRIWHNMDLLKANLDALLVKTTVSGESYQKTAKALRKGMDGALAISVNQAETIVRTESARVETQATIDLAHDKHLTFFKWYAEPSACKICAEIANYDDGYGRGVYPERDLPILPEHPNCRCSIAPYWIEK